MKLTIAPIIICTDTEYDTEIKPLVRMLGEMDLCPHRNEKRNTTWNCDTFENCDCCPFYKANAKIAEAQQILKTIRRL